MPFAKRIAAISGAGLLGCALAVIALAWILPLLPSKPYSLVVLDRHGAFVHAFRATDGVWRLRTDPTSIPPRLQSLIVEREDRWFYYHPGVNPFALLRAMLQNLRAGETVSGGSTITMQIARMLEPKERTVGGKVVEMFRAIQLELRYSKAELLEMYLSMVPEGGNIEGLRSAALLYYNIPLERLNIAHLLDLMLVPSDPCGLEPTLHADRLLAARRRLARRWSAAGVLSPRDSAIVWNTGAEARRLQLPRHASHFALRVKGEAAHGSDVFSTLDLPLHKTVESLLSRHLRPWKEHGVSNGAVMAIDNRTHDVIAYVGSENFDDAEARGQVDAVTAIRSPGSTLKPLLYAFAMDRGTLTPKTQLLDVPYDAEGFLAENYDGSYQGLVYADDALRRSLNVPMVRLLRQSGLDPFLAALQELGIHSLNSQRPRLGLSMILGGCGVTLEELTSAFAALASGGVRVRPRYRMDAAVDNEPQVVSPGTAYMLTGILSAVDRPDLPANFTSARNLPAVAFKTGTSYGRRDAWSIGYTAEYTVGVWVGNADNTGTPELVGSKAAAPLLIDILNAISTAPVRNILRRPADLGARLVCAVSGRPPTPRCARVIEDMYIPARTSADRCTWCDEYVAAVNGSYALCASCMAQQATVTIPYTRYAPELIDFWRSLGRSPAIPPPHNPLCVTVAAGDGPSIVSPSDHMTYYLASPRQQIAFHASSEPDVRAHSWYLDNRFLRHTAPGTRVFVGPSQGEHVVTCMDDRGRASRVRFRVVRL